MEVAASVSERIGEEEKLAGTDIDSVVAMFCF